jgi:hypothetical protein
MFLLNQPFICSAVKSLTENACGLSLYSESTTSNSYSIAVQICRYPDSGFVVSLSLSGQMPGYYLKDDKPIILPLDVTSSELLRKGHYINYK